VYSSRSKSVHTVVIDGQIVFEARQPTRIDAGEIFAGVQTSARKILDRMQYRLEPKWAPVDRVSPDR
jgi:hypothetical protein